MRTDRYEDYLIRMIDQRSASKPPRAPYATPPRERMLQFAISVSSFDFGAAVRRAEQSL